MTDLKAPEKRFRPEIEGVRVLAAFLVAIYHIWLGSVSGGVDVFFIVSGYLITTSLLSKMIKEGKVNIFEYLLGLMRRLLPLALTVSFFVTIGAIYILPQSRWSDTIPEIFASIFYYQNWQLAFNAVDYLAQNNAASPFQHFWALSLQGQFYVTWPIVIFIAYLIARKILKTPVRKTLLAILSIIFIASLSYSIYITTVNQPWAYFDSFARVWEFSLGGILALLIPYLSWKKSVNLIVGWLGFAIISLTGIILPVTDVFPGYAALLPTFGVILVIVSAENASKYGVQRFLGSKPLLYLGSMSYAFYLWHWPLLIFYLSYFGVEQASFIGGVAIILTALVLSFASTKMLETPVRKISVKQSKVRLATVLVCFLLPVVAVGTSWNIHVKETLAEINEETDAEEELDAPSIHDHIGEAPSGELTPPLLQAPGDLAEFYDDKECYSSTTDPEAKICYRGNTDNPDYTVALVGGSHSGHWYPPLKELSESLNFEIELYNKDACRFSTNDFDGKLSESCMEWNDNILEPMLENPPDLIFTTASVAGGSTVPSGYIGMWEKLEGITEVLAVRDNPRMPEKVPQCIEEKGFEECTVKRKYVLSEEIPWEKTENIPDNVTFADLSDYFCDEEACYPVIGDVIVYRDQHHLTATYARTLAEPLREYFLEAFEKIDQK
ncbi:acyltransferase family protein [Gracilibacillus sp. YIM 98692]|uniref:acyltransferase family protein n=1 Tax=Gracilibacillus sp. YIM 98692 TaxID=2663532 RepID=UPI0013D8750D|nr:acyltransferase family protein [Gracilibacillus sp. YIM 98692]